MEKVVHFGPGNIGRGFFGQLYYESKLETVYVGVTKEKIQLLNKYRQYPLVVMDADHVKEAKEMIIKNVRAINISDLQKVEEEISNAYLISTSVGAKNLIHIVKPIVKGLKRRWENKEYCKINILLGENMVDTDIYFKELLVKELQDDHLINMLNEYVGIVDTSVERLVPNMTKEMKQGNPLKIYAGSSYDFPVNKYAFKGEIPRIKNMILLDSFQYYKTRKIFVYNSLHAVVAYLGFVKGYQHISEAINDHHIRYIVYCSALESGKALAKEFNVSFTETLDKINSMIERLRDPDLDDTIIRVGRDPLRKLSDNDRIIGGAKLALKHRILPLNLCLAAAAALHFRVPTDNLSNVMQDMIDIGGPEEVLEKICKLQSDSILWGLILGYYEIISKGYKIF